MAAETSPETGMIGMTDFLFSFCRERKPGQGEDSFVYSLNESRALLGVFDGCGGSGAGQYPALQGKTGAFLASRAVCAAFMDWFDGLPEGQEPDPEEIKANCLRLLKRCGAAGGEEIGQRLPGGRSKKLPTTAAAALCRPVRGGVDVQLLWAGDSRVYLLDGEGLAQLTEDDLGGLDAMQELAEDRPLSNAISLSRDFVIHSGRLTMGRPGLLFAATDGCFSGYSTPMEFEYLLLSTLQGAASPQAWEEALAEGIGKAAKDDYSVSGIALNAGSFDDLKRLLAGRTKLVYRDYIRGLETCSDEEKLQLWEHYRARYQRLLCRV